MEAQRECSRLWHEGTVDRAQEHLRLSYRVDPADNKWLPVALVAKDRGLTFKVEFLARPMQENESLQKAMAAVRQELDLHLRGAYPLEVWDAAKYRCALAGDSSVHWSYHPELDEERHLSARWN